MKISFASLLSVCVTTPAFSNEAAEPETLLKARAQQVLLALQNKRNPTDVFDAHFLSEVPAVELRNLAKQIISQGGPIEGLADFHQEGDGTASFTIRFRHATAPARIDLNPTPPRLVSGFRIFSVLPEGDSLSKITVDFAALPGNTGFGIYRLTDTGPALVQGYAQTQPFAVGSTFKLYVLSALARQVQNGQRRWSDVIPLTEKSFPGGIVHSWPNGSPITLHTLATLMISVSDNSATDILIRLLGQQALSREVELSGHSNPALLKPFLTTAQFYALKRLGKSATDRYAQASLSQRTSQLSTLELDQVATSNPEEVLGHTPNAIHEVEWFGSPADVAGIMNTIRTLNSPEALAILAVNPLMDTTSQSAWGYIGYKGGSENGVMSMSWLLQEKSGTWSVATGSWNNPNASIDRQQFEILMLRLTKLVTTH